jgi:ATP-dependent RNA helicase DeaD
VLALLAASARGLRAARIGGTWAGFPALRYTPALASLSHASDVVPDRGHQLTDSSVSRCPPVSEEPTSVPSFQELGLSEPLLKALDEVGYEAPSPIQARAIPGLLSGRDLIGQAQTGTGKTGAFALPLLQGIDISLLQVQVLVLAPTRELAIQVAEVFQKYAHHLPGFHVLPIYGGQAYPVQLRPLQRGVHVVVGTPGRVIDHVKRGSLRLDNLKALVLDEADEMLNMGFLEDVEWVLEQAPEQRQIALFSATMPPAIKRIAQRHLKEPEHVALEVRMTAAETVRQRYWVVRPDRKLDALTLLLEVETFDAMIVFVRTKTAAVEIAERLEARGHAAAPLNGDIPQEHRERTVDRLRQGQLDIVVATDVAARGLDVERVSHVVNFDAPYDVESYVHRIGRTGRAGRAGEAVLFVAPREQRMLAAIERSLGQGLEPLSLPGTEEINAQRRERFKRRAIQAVEDQGLEIFESMIDELVEEKGLDPKRIAAGLARLVQGEQPLLLEAKKIPTQAGHFEDRGGQRERRKDEVKIPNSGLARYRVEVGHEHGVRPGDLVGTITGETPLTGGSIGRIDIHESFTIIDLPADLDPAVQDLIGRLEIRRNKLRLRRLSDEEIATLPAKGRGPSGPPQGRKPFKKPFRKQGGRPEGRDGSWSPGPKRPASPPRPQGEESSPGGGKSGDRRDQRERPKWSPSEGGDRRGPSRPASDRRDDRPAKKHRKGPGKGPSGGKGPKKGPSKPPWMR